MINGQRPSKSCVYDVISIADDKNAILRPLVVTEVLNDYYYIELPKTLVKDVTYCKFMPVS